jgi:glycine betaine transporter
LPDDKPPQKRLNLFNISMPVCAVVAGLGLWRPNELASVADAVTRAAFRGLDWFFMLIVTAFLLLCLWFAFGRHGKIRLSKNDERPEFSTASWLSMLFAAGMGVGLLFWGVAEPVMHFGGAPGPEVGSTAAARHAFVVTGFHWGLHAWAVYGIAALVLAYFGFKKGTPYLPGGPLRATFSGRWVEPVSGASDLVAVLAIAFGVAGSIGMGTFQLHTGLAAVGLVPDESLAVDMTILGVLIVAYLASASTSLDKGIQILSNVNMALAILLLAFLLFAGPTAHLLRTFATGVGDYFANLIPMSLQLYPYADEGARGWAHSWTLTYFVWWIAWAPFVGIFIARISKGRTIREFVLGVLFAPTAFSLLWFAVFGGTGLYEELFGAGEVLRMVREDVAVALFSLLERLPLSLLLSGTALVLVFIFLVTSVDSATFVLGMLTTRGSLNPPTRRKVLWGLALGGLGGALTLSGSIDAVRAVAVLGALPFTFVMVLQVAAFLRALSKEPRR